MRFMDAESKFEHMVAIIPSWMKIAAVFARLALQMFRGKITCKTRFSGYITRRSVERIFTI